MTRTKSAPSRLRRLLTPRNVLVATVLLALVAAAIVIYVQRTSEPLRTLYHLP